MDAGPFQAAMDTLIRDKNQALDQLDKVGRGHGGAVRKAGRGRSAIIVDQVLCGTARVARVELAFGFPIQVFAR